MDTTLSKLQICPSTFVSMGDAMERCVVTVDGEIVGYTTFDEEGPTVAKNLAEFEVNRLKGIHGETIKVHCEASKDGKTSKIYTQRLGYLYNSKPELVMTIEVFNIPRISITNGRGDSS